MTNFLLNMNFFFESVNDREELSIVEYPHLINLVLDEVHDDYIEQVCLMVLVFLSPVTHYKE